MSKAKDRLTNDQRIAECLRILGAGVAINPKDRVTFDTHVNAMLKKPKKETEAE